ncbi:MAG: hypothetical protein ABIK28_17820 [Planctomycetota bacterium]
MKLHGTHRLFLCALFFFFLHLLPWGERLSTTPPDIIMEALWCPEDHYIYMDFAPRCMLPADATHLDVIVFTQEADEDQEASGESLNAKALTREHWRPASIRASISSWM